MQRKQQKTWTIKEIKFIQDNYTNMTITEMAKFLGRSYGSVKNKVLYMGLKRTTERETKEYAYYVGDELVCLGKIHEIEKFTGISKKNLFLYRFESYKKRLKRELVEIM